jgi:hypothetical protein
MLTAAQVGPAPPTSEQLAHAPALPEPEDLMPPPPPRRPAALRMQQGLATAGMLAAQDTDGRR